MKQQNFTQMLSIFKGSRIDLLLRNDQLMEVTLLDIKQDHIIVDMNDHIFYITIPYIQALSKR